MNESAAVAHSEHYLDQEFKDQPDLKIEWSFFKGAGPAVNEALANNQLDFAIQGDLPEIIGICDRVVVMRAGRIAGDIRHGANAPIVQEKIMALATGMEQSHA